MATPVRHNIRISTDPEELALQAASMFGSLSQEAIALRGKFRLSLSGGSTPLRLYSLLAAEPYRSNTDWRHVEFFFGDERCVPPQHRDSNFKSIDEALLSHVPSKSHRIEGELSPREAAIRYEGELRRSFGMEQGFPVFDLVLLGLGEDGHTASLFPGTNALSSKDRLAVEVHVKNLDSWRVTVTLPVINSARKVVFLVTGGRKARIVREVIEGQKICPASLVLPVHGETLWLLDKAAASLL